LQELRSDKRDDKGIEKCGCSLPVVSILSFTGRERRSR